MSQPEPRSSSVLVLLGFLGGAAVGAIAAVLFAPRSGAETRRRLAGVVNDTQEAAGRMPQAIRDATSAAQAAFVAALK